MTSLASLGLEHKTFLQDNIPIATYSYLDLGSLQFLLDNGVTVEDIARKLVKAIIHYDANYQESLKINLQFIVAKGADITQISLPINTLDIYKKALINAKSATAILKSALVTDIGTYSYPAGYQVDQAKLAAQQNVILETVKHGADVNTLFDQMYSVNFMALQRNKDSLLTTISAQNFLKLLLKVNASSEADITLQGELIKEALDKGADVNAMFSNGGCTISSVDILSAHKELLLNHSTYPMTALNFLKLALETGITKYNYATQQHEPDPEMIKVQGELIKEALDKGADVNELDYISLEKNIIAHGDLFSDSQNPLSADKLLKLALHAKVSTYDQATQKEVVDLEKVKLQGVLIKQALDRGAKFAEEAIEISVDSASLFYNKELLLEHSTNPISGELLVQIMLNSLERRAYGNEGLVIDNEKIRQQNEIIKYAIEQGADLNSKTSFEERSLTLYEQFFALNNFALLDLVQEVHPVVNYTLGTPAWAIAIHNNYNIGFITHALQKFPQGFSINEADDFMRALGASHAAIHAIFDIYALAKDVINASVEQQSPVLSATELQILSTIENIALADCATGEYINSYGFSPLLLALLVGKFELAIEMIKSGSSLTEKSAHGITPIQIIMLLADSKKFLSAHINAFKAVVFEKLDNLDIILNEQGESLIDSFLGDANFQNEALDRTNDSLFAFYKPKANLFSPSLHPEQTHIAISMGEGFWSTGLNAVSRLISKEHPEVSFHLVALEMMNTGGDKFIRQFNGWVNPGAGDSFPKNKKEFNKDDWEQSMILKQAYQKALAKTHEFKIPYIGMCAGAQNFALYHDGYLHPLKGYAGGKHTMHFKPATLSHFMAMTKEQQKHALNNCEFPEIAFKGDTAHHYAAVANKLGSGLQLGAVSEEGIAMSYAHENGLRYATQFHPEHYYHLSYDKHGGVNHQKVWLENFIYLTKLHHNHTTKGAVHPEVVFDYVSNRLDECIKALTCLGEENVFNNTNIAQVLFEY